MSTEPIEPRPPKDDETQSATEPASFGWAEDPDTNVAGLDVGTFTGTNENNESKG